MQFSSPGALPSSGTSTSLQCLACRDHSPVGEGYNGAGPSSRCEDGVLQPLLHCTQERLWVKANLGFARLELSPSQAPTQDAHAEAHVRD